MVEATHPPILFLTGKTNFRNEIAKRQPYKQRASNKPFHYKNLIAYIKGKYDYRISEGLEADDLLAIEQFSRMDETIICTRDKDLLQVQGWHYGWEIGKQASFGPEKVEGFGYLRWDEEKKKLRGVGDAFFYAQCLMGDPVDSIPGIPKCGPKKAFKLLEHTNTSTEALKIVYGAYKAFYGMSGYKEMLEQARLLWMIRKLRPDGSPVMWGQSQ
jgi:5'-3' exonuclease